jgi:MFS family permease
MNFELTGLSILIIGFGAGVEYDLMAYLVGRYFGLKSYSAIYGAQYGFFAAGAGSGPAIFALMYDRTGSFQMPMLIAAGLLLFGALILLSLGRYREFAPPVEQPAT